MRTVRIVLDEVKPEMWDAIKYFASWAYPDEQSGFDKVSIYPEGNLDLIAHFSNSKNNREYTIGAIWREELNKHSFHS